MSTRMFVSVAIAACALIGLGCDNARASALATGLATVVEPSRASALASGKGDRDFTPRTQPKLRRVFDQDFPDPSVIKAPDGWYYAYATQTVVGESAPHIVNIQVARSLDLQAWVFMGDALPVKPKWAKRTQKFWAPDVAFDSGHYFMYFSAEPNSHDGLCLGVATAESPAGPFRDLGHPLSCAPGFSEIDPMHFDDPATGKKFLYWGSGFQPLRVQELAPSRLAFARGSQPTELVAPHADGDPDDNMNLIEGSWLTKHDGYYYLFFSGNNCCEPDPHYAVMVARSENATGPFELLGDQPGHDDSVVVGSDVDVIAPGHNSVIEGPDGRPWIVFHGIDRSHMYLKNPIAGDRTVRRVLFAQPLEFRSGWPSLAE